MLSKSEPPASESHSPQQPPIPASPTLAWRAGSAFVMGTVGAIVRSFTYGLSYPQVNGLDNFLKILDERIDVDKRQRGLITGKRTDVDDRETDIC